jgi:hypothetical protein
MPSVSPPVMITVKQCMVSEIFFCISVVAPEKSLGTTDLDYWVFGLCPSSGILKNTQRFEIWICFRPQVQGRGAPTQLGPFERANPNHWTDPFFRNVVCVFFRIPDDGQSPKTQ